MVRRQTWILLVVFVILLGGAVYLQKNPLPSSGGNVTPSPTAQASLLPGWQAQEITYIELKGGQGGDVQVSKGNGTWTLAPDGKVIAPGKIEETLAQIADTHVMASLPTDFVLDAGGLATPAQVLTVRSGQGKQAVVKIGKATPTDTGYYVQVDKNAPVVVDKAVIETLQQQLSKENLAPTPTAGLTPGATKPEATPTPTP